MHSLYTNHKIHSWYGHVSAPSCRLQGSVKTWNSSPTRKLPEDGIPVPKHVDTKNYVYFIQTNSCTLFKTHSHSHLKH